MRRFYALVAVFGAAAIPVVLLPSCDQPLETPLLGAVREAVAGEAGQPELAVTQGGVTVTSGAVHDVGSTYVNNPDPHEVRFLIENQGSVSLELTGTPVVSVEPGSGFSFVGSQPAGSIPPGDTAAFVVKLENDLEGTDKQALVSIPNNDADEGDFTFTIQGTVAPEPMPDIRVSQAGDDLHNGSASYSFESVLADGDGGIHSSNVVFTIANAGSADLSITAIDLASGDTSDFDLSNTAGSLVHAGESTTFAIAFDPQSAGAKHATVRIDSDDPDDGAFTFGVTGTGDLYAPRIRVAQAGTEIPTDSGSYSFGDVIHDGDGGEYSDWCVFTVHNDGTAPLNVSGVSLSAGDLMDFDLLDNTTSTVDPAQSTTFAVRFDPVRAESRAATVNISNSDSDANPYTFTVAGSGAIKLVPQAGGAADDEFGRSVSISGDYVVVGAPGDSQWGNAAGAAYIFHRNQGGTNAWNQVVKLHAADAEPIDKFGSSVGISGNYAVVGAPAEDQDGMGAGAAYVYYRHQGGTNNWGQQAKLRASDGAGYSDFGATVATSGDYVVVGAPMHDESGASNIGAVYVFKRSGSTWTEVAKSIPNDADVSDHFGRSVAITGTSYAIAGTRDPGYGTNRGGAYILPRDVFGDETWHPHNLLTNQPWADWDYFGESVAISYYYAVIGTPYDDDRGTDSGSVSIAARDISTWGDTTKLLAPDGAAGDSFGRAVGISGDNVIVGALGDDDNGDSSGSAYIFSRDGTTWNQESKFLAIDGAASDWFGLAVGISSTYCVVGAPGKQDSAGAAYVYRY